MIVKLIKTKNKTLFKVNRQVFKKGSNTFIHLMNKISGIEPNKIIDRLYRGKYNEKVYYYNVKGVVPKYGYTLGNVVNHNLKVKLYETVQ